MANSKSDYSTYSYEDLLDVRNNIDQYKFPDRAKVVNKLISEKATEQPVSSGGYSAGQKTIVALIGGELLFWIVLAAAALLGYAIF